MAKLRSIWKYGFILHFEHLVKIACKWTDYNIISQNVEY